MRKINYFFRLILSLLVKTIRAVRIKLVLNSIEVGDYSQNNIIVFHTVRYTRLYHDGLFAKIFAQRGNKIYLILDDGCLLHWDSVRFNQSNTSKALTPFLEKGIAYYINKIDFYIKLWTYSDKNIEYIYYSDIQEKIKNKDHFDIDLEYYARSSTIRYYENTDLDFESHNVKKYFEESVNVSQNSLIIGKYIKEFLDPDYFINNLGIYSCMGPCNEYLRREGYNTKIYCRSAYRDYHLIIDKEKAQILSRSEKWESFKRKPFSNKARKKAERFMKSRLSHDTSDTKIYFKNSSSTIDYKLKDESKITFGVFPNVVWDGDERERNVIFDDVVNWLIELVDHFQKIDRYNLVIRFHPSEATFFTNSKKLETIIRERLPDIDSYDHIYLVSSKSNLNTYKMIDEKIDIGMVYDGMLGLELPILGKPVIFAGKGAIDKDYIMNGISIEDKEDYFKVLDSPETIIEKFNADKEEWKRKALKYIYWYVFKNTFYSPTANELGKGFGDFSLNHFSKKELNPLENKRFAKTINEFLK